MRVCNAEQNSLRERPGQRAQTAIEYMVIVGVVTALVLAAFHTFVPKARDDTNAYYMTFLSGYFGSNPTTGSGFTDYP